MIPFNTLALIGCFVAFYVIGLLFSIALMIESIMDRHIKTAIFSIMLTLIYTTFGLALL